MVQDYLCSLIGRYRSLSIIGMCKNAGKTTVLNHIIRKMAKEDRLPALTSIGRDGETFDIASGTAKPKIYIYRGSLIATASGLLDSCDITKEFLLSTGISTPLGEVIVIRALSDGYVQLAGPSMISQLEQLSQTFSQLGAGITIIDGAVGRRTLCTRSLTEGTILCTGASCGASMDLVIKETKHVVQMLNLPVTNDAALQEAITAQKNDSGKTILCGSKYISLPTAMSIEEGLQKNQENNTTHIYINGAFSNSVVQSILLSGVKLSGILFVVRDASKVLINAANYEKMRRLQSGIQVLDGINLLAVAINPFSVSGYNFNKDNFRASLSSQIDVPVINAEEIND
jgi:hypothetical protein